MQVLIIWYITSGISCFICVETARAFSPDADFFKKLSKKLYLFLVFTPLVNTIVVLFTFITIVVLNIFDSKRWIINIFNSVRRFLGYYDSLGLRYSGKHLRRVRDLIPLWTREQQAEYADIITVKGFSEEGWIEQVQSLSPDTWFNDYAWNTTTIGNLAYVALHARNVLIITHLEKCLENLRIHYISVNK